MSAPQPQPRILTAAFWCWLAAAVMLIVGGVIAASANLPGGFRGTGVLTVLAGVGMAFLVGRSRNGDVRYRRAAVALSLTIVVLVALLSVFGVVHVLALLAVLPLIVGSALITRSGAPALKAGEP